MRRWIRITLLALGTILGYGFAIHAMRHHHYGYGHYGYDGHDRWCDHDAWDRSSHGPPPPQGQPASPAQPPPAPPRAPE